MSEEPKYEHLFDGGLAGQDKDDRTDMYLQECADGTMQLSIVSGSGVFQVVDCRPEDLVALGRWIDATAKDFLVRRMIKA